MPFAEDVATRRVVPLAVTAASTATLTPRLALDDDEDDVVAAVAVVCGLTRGRPRGGMCDQFFQVCAMSLSRLRLSLTVLLFVLRACVLLQVNDGQNAC